MQKEKKTDLAKFISKKEEKSLFIIGISPLPHHQPPHHRRLPAAMKRNRHHISPLGQISNRHPRAGLDLLLGSDHLPIGMVNGEVHGMPGIRVDDKPLACRIGIQADGGFGQPYFSPIQII
jgi:hypothetical protein